MLTQADVAICVRTQGMRSPLRPPVWFGLATVTDSRRGRGAIYNRLLAELAAMQPCKIPPCARCGANQSPLTSTGCVIEEGTFVYTASFNATTEARVRRTINPSFRWEDVRDVEG